MCRLLAYVCDNRRSVEDLLGPTAFTSFRELSRLHRDGWGMAWLDDGPDDGPEDGPDQHDPSHPHDPHDPHTHDPNHPHDPHHSNHPNHSNGPHPLNDLSDAHLDPSDGALVEGALRARRSVLPAYEDPVFADLASQPLGRAGMVHLRWATSGLAVAEANTHPFLASGWAFAHQGSIPEPDRIDALLDSEWLSRRHGATDSERYFLLLLQCVEQEGDLVAGIRRAVTEILDACGDASLNAMLLSSEWLVVVHGRAGLEPPRDDLLAAVPTPEDVPPDHLEGYFDLRYRLVDGDVVVTSSGLPTDGWEEFPDDSLLHVDLGTRAMSFHAFADPR